jgi:hypothetical protein
MPISTSMGYICHEPAHPPGDGGDGGKAGAAGKAGLGADGGDVYFVGPQDFIEATRDFAVANPGGTNGQNGEPGIPGPPGAGGPGGYIAKGCGGGKFNDGRAGHRHDRPAALAAPTYRAANGQIFEYVR